MVSLPSPEFILDQKQAELTQRILDSLGNGLDVGVLGHVVYGLRRGEVKAFWSFSRFDHSRTPQEISKLEPQPLYLFKDFIQGGRSTSQMLIWHLSSSSWAVTLFYVRNSGFCQWQRQPSPLLVLVSGREMARPRQQALGEETYHSGGERTSLIMKPHRQHVENLRWISVWQLKYSLLHKAVRVHEK